MNRLTIIAMDQPGWIWRAAIGTIVLLLLLPVMLLVVFALLAGAIVFGVLAAVAMLMQRVRSMLPRSMSRDDGRENVRVIVRREP